MALFPYIDRSRHAASFQLLDALVRFLLSTLATTPGLRGSDGEGLARYQEGTFATSQMAYIKLDSDNLDS